MSIKQNFELETGDILHCSRKGIVATLIRKFTKSPISHTAVVVEVWGNTYIIDAQSNGVNLKPFEEWLRKYKYQFIVARPVKPVDEYMFSMKAFLKIGVTGYDFASLLWRHPLAIITGNWRKKYDPTDKSMVCSQYVAYTYGIVDSYRMTPKDMFEWTEKNEFIHRKFKYNLVD
jgi:hypothetical protein